MKYLVQYYRVLDGTATLVKEIMSSEQLISFVKCTDVFTNRYRMLEMQQIPDRDTILQADCH